MKTAFNVKVGFRNNSLKIDIQFFTYIFFLPSEIADMLPGILNQLGAESLSSLKKLAQSGKWINFWNPIILH